LLYIYVYILQDGFLTKAEILANPDTFVGSQSTEYVDGFHDEL